MPHNDQDLVAITDAMPHIVWLHDAAGQVSYFNQQWTAYTGDTLAATVANGAASYVHPQDRDAIMTLFVRGRETAAPLEATYRLRRQDGAYRWHHARVVPFRGIFLGTAIDVHEQHVLQAERQHLIDATRVLGTSLELARTLSDVAKLLVPHVADWIGIDLLQANGALAQVAVAHIDPSKIALAHELRKRLPPKPSDPTGPYNVIRTGQPEMVREITDEMLVAGLPDPELLAIYRGLGLRSAMTVPLHVRGRAIGTVALVSAEGERLFEERDLVFATELATRIAIAVDNARLFEDVTRARQTAEAFAQEILEQSKAVEATVHQLRRERDEALGRTKG